jgi:hypothetical protein
VTREGAARLHGAARSRGAMPARRAVRRQLRGGTPPISTAKRLGRRAVTLNRALRLAAAHFLVISRMSCFGSYSTFGESFGFTVASMMMQDLSTLIIG